MGGGIVEVEVGVEVEFDEGPEAVAFAVAAVFTVDVVFALFVAFPAAKTDCKPNAGTTAPSKITIKINPLI
ncbi:MAG: hypothetical protein ACREAN_06760 [Nitrosopumilaceae archaeon]